MSWEANIWAIKQRMKLPQEQLVLIVLGNCADPDAVAFSTWPGRDHWWKYLAKVTRLSRSSLFRHINTIVGLGLASRSDMVLSDGSRRPTITLNLDASFNIETEEERYFAATQRPSRGQSHSETENDSDDDESENVNENIALEDENAAEKRESHSETIGNIASQSPPSGTVSVPPARLHIDSSKSCSKESPPTPSGGFERDDLWDKFVKAWAQPIAKYELARSVWDDVPTARRGEAITAARGYRAYRAKDPKPPAEISAQSFLRQDSGWAQWLAYAPEGDVTPSISISYPVGSREGQAIILLHKIAGLQAYLDSVMIRKGVVNYIRPMTPRVAALAAAPVSGWATLTHQQACAWDEMLREAIIVQNRHRLKEGDRAPWPWPPRKDGTLSQTGPPDRMTG